MRRIVAVTVCAVSGSSGLMRLSVREAYRDKAAAIKTATGANKEAGRIMRFSLSQPKRDRVTYPAALRLPSRNPTNCCLRSYRHLYGGLVERLLRRLLSVQIVQ